MHCGIYLGANIKSSVIRDVCSVVTVLPAGVPGYPMAAAASMR